jgi:hypothetical protein
MMSEDDRHPGRNESSPDERNERNEPNELDGSNGVIDDEALDRDLSALMDRALDSDREVGLLDRLDADPVAASRLDALKDVDRALRALPGPDLQADLRERLNARIDEPGRIVANQLPDPDARATGWRVPVAAILAASVVAGLVVYSSSVKRDDLEVAAAIPTPAEEETPAVTVVSLDPSEMNPDQIPVDDLAVALDYDTLRDLDMIRELDLLETLVAMNDAGRS